MLKARDVSVEVVDNSIIDLTFMRKGSTQSLSSVSGNTGGNNGGGEEVYNPYVTIIASSDGSVTYSTKSTKPVVARW